MYKSCATLDNVACLKICDNYPLNDKAEVTFTLPLSILHTYKERLNRQRLNGLI